MSPSMLNCYDTVPNQQAQKIQTVEGQLWMTYKALAETEGRVHLFSTLRNMGLATNDIMSFVEKQSMHKRVNRELDNKVMSSAMKSKLVDACTHMKRLRLLRSIRTFF